ncbi:MAG: urease accessory protein UreD [Opitutus sp.]
MSEFSGHLHLRAALRENGRTVLATQSFRAPFHLSKPYWDADSQTLLAQIVNPTAGILAGDRLESSVVVDEGAALLVTTPSASRVFQMKDGTAECRQHLTVADRAWLEVMPEPLVPHRGSSYWQRTRIDVALGGELFYADLLMPGRIAHGEAWEWVSLRLETEVRLGEELILRERFDQTGAGLKSLAALAGSGANACFANIVVVAREDPRDGAWQSAVNSLQGEGLWIGVSALRRGGWSIKLVAVDSLRLRAALKSVRQALAERFVHLRCDPRKL